MVNYFSPNSGALRFDDFMNIIMPCDAPDLRDMVSRRRNHRGPLDPRVERELAKLIELEVHYNRIVESSKQVLESNKQFDYVQAFNAIDDWNYGYIDYKNLKNFFRKHNTVASELDCMAIIRRMDLDGDARVSREEFI